MEIENVLLLVALITLGSAASFVLSLVALWRSRHHDNLLKHHLDSLESRVGVLWNEVMVFHRSHDSAKAKSTEMPVPAAKIVPHPILPVIREEVAIAATASEQLEPQVVAKSVRPVVEVCPKCRLQWDGKKCDCCGYRAASAPSVPALQTTSDLRPWEKAQQLAQSLKGQGEQTVSGGVVHTQPRPAAEATPTLAGNRTLPGLPKRREHEAWEAVIGASWLNKIGVLLLVVGIALFIGYSLARLGPMGRLVIAFAVSSCMLFIGAALERKPLYQVFGRGIAAGGWAGLYFTTYAMYGLEAVRVIDSPTIDFLLLISVASGMIAHSLYYRAETVTAVAYFCGFVAISILPVSLFSAVACVVLAGTLLIVAYRYSWHTLAVFGVVCTYGSFAIQFNLALYTSKIWLDFTTGHVVIGACWLLFEAFDIAVVAQKRQQLGVGRTLLPLNACGLLGLLLLQWRLDSSELYLLFVATAVAYIASTIVRAVTRPTSAFGSETNSIDRVFLGSYEASITIAAALAAIAIWQKYPNGGWRLEISWLIEAEFLFLAGVFLVQRYLRALAIPILMLVLARIVAFDLLQEGVVHLSTLEVMHWTPLALLLAAVGYFNRALLERAQETGLLRLEYGYSFSATAFVVLVLGFEIWFRHNHLQPEYLGISWLAVALVLMEVALRTRLTEFYAQSYAVGLLGILVLFLLNGFLIYPDTLPADTWQIWIWLLPASVALYATSIRASRWPPIDLEPDVLFWLHQPMQAAATGLLVLFIWQAFPSTLVAVGWGLCAWLLIHIGFGLKQPGLRWQGYAISGLMIGRLFFANFTNPGMSFEISHRLLTVCPIVMFCYFLSSRLRGQQGQEPTSEAEHSLSRVYLYAAAFVTLVLMRFELGRVLAVLGWSGYGLLLLYVGLRQDMKDLRWQSYLIALLTFGRSWGTNFYVPEGLSGIFTPIVIGSLVTGSLYLSHLLCLVKANEAAPSCSRGFLSLLPWLDSHARALFCTLGTVLLGVLLIYEAPSGLLTASWGIEGTVLLLAGFILRDRVFRFAGLAVMAVCLPKLFLFDLQQLATPYRILSFIVLGLLLIIASWIYTRFKSQLQAYI
ncbi:MAG: DUF2339 domain-containing protein [Pirellula sp.]